MNGVVTKNPTTEKIINKQLIADFSAFLHHSSPRVDFKFHSFLIKFLDAFSCDFYGFFITLFDPVFYSMIVILTV